MEQEQPEQPMEENPSESTTSAQPEIGQQSYTSGGDGGRCDEDEDDGDNENENKVENEGENEEEDNGDKDDDEDDDSGSGNDDERSEETDEEDQIDDSVDQSAICDVCGDDASWEDNPILLCDGCDVAVHTLCYGIKVFLQIYEMHPP